MSEQAFGLQLYSLREETAKDFQGTIARVAEMGYRGVEFAGYGGIKPDEMARLVKENNLEVYGTHFGKLPKTQRELDLEIEMNLALNNPYLICPYMPMETRQDALCLAELMNQCQRQLRPHGLRLGYHNHAHEFKQADGQYLMDILLENTDPDIFAEIDVFWVAYAGLDPIQYIQKYPGRQPVIHLKELGRDKKTNVEIGQGILDFGAIIQTARTLGVERFIVEQEEYTMPPLQSCEASLKALEKLDLA